MYTFKEKITILISRGYEKEDVIELTSDQLDELLWLSDTGNQDDLPF